MPTNDMRLRWQPSFLRSSPPLGFYLLPYADGKQGSKNQVVITKRNHEAKNPSVCTRTPPVAQASIWLLTLLMLLSSGGNLQAQTTYKKRALFYGPTLADPQTGPEVTFINNHPAEFQPVDPNNPVAPGNSQVWNEQQWINAAVTDFQAFDVIIFSDTGSSQTHWPAALASRAIWGSAINGNIFITSGDPVADSFGRPEALRVFRQCLRFGSIQPGNAHARTGLYLALGHSSPGQDLNGTVNPTEIDLLSWFGSFKAITVQQSGVMRLVAANPTLNVLERDINGWDEASSPGFHSWPAPFVAIAQHIFDNNPTPSNNPFYFAPLEAGDNGVGDTGYRSCVGQRPLAYILAKPVNLADLTRLIPAQPNIAATIGQSCNFSAQSLIAPDPNPNNPSGPSTQVSWRVVSGPNAGLHGKCTRQVGPAPYFLPTGIWTASYTDQGFGDANNFQDVVQLFLDYPQAGTPPNEELNDMSNSADSNDPDDPAPGMTIEYATTFTINWGSPNVTITTLANATEGVGSSCNGSVRLTRSPLTAGALAVKLCLGGTATFGTGADGDYIITVGGLPVSVVNGEFNATIPSGLTTVDITVLPVDDTRAEGTENVRLALKDVFGSEHTYVVGGVGFTEVSLTDNDQPLVTVGGYIGASEQYPSGAWIFDTATAITEPLKIYFTLGGTASNEVDYLSTLTPANDFEEGDAIVLPSGIGRITIQPTASSPLGAGHHAAFVSMSVFQDSRTEGAESATVTLLPHPNYKFTSASGSVNITDDDFPKIPANGYTITELADSYHTSTYAVGLNNNNPPQVAGSFVPYGSPTGYYLATRYENGFFTDVQPLAGLSGNHLMLNQCLNANGWMAGSAQAVLNGNATLYYYLWDGVNTVQLQTPDIAATGQGPRAINDAGWIVGSAMNSAFHVQRATRWDASGNFVDLGGLNSDLDTSAFAWGLSSSASGHRIIGESQIILNGVNAKTTAFHAYRTQANSEPQQIAFSDDLGNGLASETSSSGAYTVNALFEIAGYSSFSATEKRAAYKDGNSRKNLGWRTLGVLSGGSGTGWSAQALGMNDVGLIVGWSRTITTGTGNPKAVVWENYQAPAATDLNLKIPLADRPNWLLQYATGINTTGRIVGYGLKNGQQRAFLLTPLP